MVGILKWVILCMLLIAGLVIGNLGCSKTVPTTTVPTTTVPTTTVPTTTGKVNTLGFTTLMVATLMYEGDWKGSFTYTELKTDAEGKRVFAMDGQAMMSIYENPKDLKISLTLASALPNGIEWMTSVLTDAATVVNLNITKVWVSDPRFGTGPTGIALNTQAWLPTDSPTNTSKPSQDLIGIVIQFPNGYYLRTGVGRESLVVSADWKTMSSSGIPSPPKQAQMWEWDMIPPPDMDMSIADPRHPIWWKHESWTLSKVTEGEGVSAVKKELQNTSREDLVKALDEILQYNNWYWINPTDIYYTWRSQVRANQSLREKPPGKYEGYEFLGRSIVKESTMWAEHVQAHNWADYPAEEMMHRVEGEMATKQSILVKDTIISDHYRRLK